MNNALSFCMGTQTNFANYSADIATCSGGESCPRHNSLSITILNRYWVRKEFNELRTKAHASSVRSKYEALEERVEACRFLLQEAQQVRPSPRQHGETMV